MRGWKEVTANQVPEPITEELLELGIGAWGLVFLGPIFGLNSVNQAFQGIKTLKKMGLGLAGLVVWAWSSEQDEEESPGIYRCGICGEKGHNRRTCEQNISCTNCDNNDPSIEKFRLENPESDDSVMVCENCT